MKILYLIPLLSLCLFLTSCSPQGDFWGTKAVVVCKNQSTNDKEKKQAEYVIRFGDGKTYVNLTLLFAEDWADVGDQVNGVRGAKIVSKPSSVKVENE